MGAITRIEYAPDWRAQLQALGEEPLGRAADRVLDAMKTTIPVSTEGSHGRPAGYARSRLRTLERGRMTTGEPYRDVGTDATTPDGESYPAMQHYGTKPHVIESHGAYPLRDSHGRVYGRPVIQSGRLVGWRVNHPGTRATYWGTRAAMTIHGARL